MTEPAPILAPARRTYRGRITKPERWTAWQARKGDILVSTPPKSGTTWTQAILSMLVKGGPKLSEKLPVVSPWVDADLGIPAEDVAAALDRQIGRRVIKTHTPGDGFPVWDGVTVVAVYRHPLDVFFSLRKHTANRKNADPDHPMLWPVSPSLLRFVDAPVDPDQIDNDSVETIALHYTETVLRGRIPGLVLLHYDDMLRDPYGTVERLAIAARIEVTRAQIDAVAEATSFTSMKAEASSYAPVGGTGFWHSDAAFFDSAASRKWNGQVSDADYAHFEDRLAHLIPDEEARRWLLEGSDGA